MSILARTRFLTDEVNIKGQQWSEHNSIQMR